MLPVGAIVNNWEFLNPKRFTAFLVASLVFSMKYKFLSNASGLNLLYGFSSLAKYAEVPIAVSAITKPIRSHKYIESALPYSIPILISMSAKPNIPKPICLQSATDFLCSSNGCNSKPSSKTSFKAITACDTVSAKSSKSNFPSLTKADKLMEPNKQLPPAGSGSSAHGLTPANLNSGSFARRFHFSIRSQNNIPGSP